ncbi:hypothetical protein MJM95_30540, partial [Salmonella enterica subsp. enterica serovar Anatum]|nr:hypothetical protein [Salmonella enterica subsp. enterica serovar Anatum]
AASFLKGLTVFYLLRKTYEVKPDEPFLFHAAAGGVGLIACQWYTISYSGKVEVPQNCEVNAGQVVEFDFGDIGASLFSQAGAGN